MDIRKITIPILAVFAVIAAITFGQWSASDPKLAAAGTLAVVALIVVALMGIRIWLLIPLTLAFTGTLTVLPGGFALRDVVMGFASALMIMHWIVRRYPTRFHFGFIEVAFGLQFGILAMAFLRNPAGLRVLGSATVGGKPYFEIAVSILTYVMLSSLVVPFKDAKRMVILAIVGAIGVAVFETVVGLFPSIAVGAAHVYYGKTTGASINDGQGGGQTGGFDVGRLTFLGMFSKPIMSFILGFRTPFQLVDPKKPLTILAVLIVIICVFMSGFRSGLVSMALMVIAAAVVHRKMIQLFALSMLGVPILMALVVMQGSVIDLPAPAQRALSFLPGDWDHNVVLDAKGSSEWRFEMWEEALKSDRYIRNKWIGDGYGFSTDELEYQADISVRLVTPEELQEYFLMTGSYHSGPVETIKRTGYVGLLSMWLLQITLMVFTFRLINRLRYSLYYPYAVIVGLPFIILPFVFTFIFGAYQDAMSQIAVGLGMLRLIQNSFEQHLVEEDLQRSAREAEEMIEEQAHS